MYVEDDIVPRVIPLPNTNEEICALLVTLTSTGPRAVDRLQAADR
jgi:hypothetical protein